MEDFLAGAKKAATDAVNGVVQYEKESLHNAAHCLTNPVCAAMSFGPGALEGGDGQALGAARANKLNHVFGNAGHGLDAVVKAFGGEGEAMNAIEKATAQYVKAKGITGQFEGVVRVGSQNVTVRGNVIDGVAMIGTAFIPK